MCNGAIKQNSHARLTYLSNLESCSTPHHPLHATFWTCEALCLPRMRAESCLSLNHVSPLLRLEARTEIANRDSLNNSGCRDIKIEHHVT
jgi:hypothetical protein